MVLWIGRRRRIKEGKEKREAFEVAETAPLSFDEHKLKTN